MVFMPSSIIESPTTPIESPPVERIVPVKKRRYAAVIESTPTLSSTTDTTVQQHQQYSLSTEFAKLNEIIQLGCKCVHKTNIDQLIGVDIFPRDQFGQIFDQFHMDILLCDAQYQSIIDRSTSNDIRSQLQLASAYLAIGNMRKCCELAISALVLSDGVTISTCPSPTTQHRAVYIDAHWQSTRYIFRLVDYCMRRRLQLSTASDRLLGQLIIISQLHWSTHGRQLFDTIYEHICNRSTSFVYRNLLAHINNLDILEHFSYLIVHRRDSPRLQLTDTADSER